ncbi:MAG: hypothetical protein H6723_08765 [Sandaracinus sp.]|nr:hypothetical protein [Sandaracinus sp.]
MVRASWPVASVRRLAARPVGAASKTLRPSNSCACTNARTVVVLPVPGPPGQHEQTFVDRRAHGRALLVAHREPFGRASQHLVASTLGPSRAREPGEHLGHETLRGVQRRRVTRVFFEHDQAALRERVDRLVGSRERHVQTLRAARQVLALDEDVPVVRGFGQ